MAKTTPKVNDRVTVSITGIRTAWDPGTGSFEIKTENRSFVAITRNLVDDPNTVVTILRGPLPEEIGTVLYDRTADVTWVRVGAPWSDKGGAWVNLHTGAVHAKSYIPAAWQDGLLELKTTL